MIASKDQVFVCWSGHRLLPGGLDFRINWLTEDLCRGDFSIFTHGIFNATRKKNEVSNPREPYLQVQENSFEFFQNCTLQYFVRAHESFKGDMHLLLV